MSDELATLLADPKHRTYGKTALYRKSLSSDKAFIECKANSPTSKNGTIEGYASVWDVVDHQNEIVRKGAFTKTIQERGAKIPIMIQHFAAGGDVLQAVGGSVSLVEDNYGLKFSAEWFDDAMSQAVRQKVVNLRKNDLAVGTSIGYRVINYGYINDEASGKTVVELKELALGEVTITLQPACEPALVTSAKTVGDHVSVLAPFEAIQTAKIEELDAEARTKLIEDVYGDPENAKSLSDALKGIADRTLALLAAKPQAAASEDGDSTSGSSLPKHAGKNADGDSSTKEKVDPRMQAKRELERMRMSVMRRKKGRT